MKLEYQMESAIATICVSLAVTQWSSSVAVIRSHIQCAFENLTGRSSMQSLLVVDNVGSIKLHQRSKN